VDSYGDYTDEQLIEKLRGGEERIMDFILDKYKPLVRKRANAMYLIGGDTDDLIQEGMIGLFKAIRDYNPQREASFFHFAELCINRQLYSVVEASNRKKHAPLNTYISFYARGKEKGQTLVESLPAAGQQNPEEMLIDQENVEQFWKRARGKLSKMEQQVLDEYLSGLNYQQIAKQMGKNPKAIDNALQRIKGKIR
jgi:RNA polymerase sporulation-specific sigma factor